MLPNKTDVASRTVTLPFKVQSCLSGQQRFIIRVESPFFFFLYTDMMLSTRLNFRCGITVLPYSSETSFRRVMLPYQVQKKNVCSFFFFFFFFFFCQLMMLILERKGTYSFRPNSSGLGVVGAKLEMFVIRVRGKSGVQFLFVWCHHIRVKLIFRTIW